MTSMKDYFKVDFKVIHAELSRVSSADVWETEQYKYGDEVISVNKFGFDPNNTNRYFQDEYWMMSDDSRYWNAGLSAIKKYEALIARFPKKKADDKPKPVYKFIDDEKRLMKKMESKIILVHIIRWSDEWACSYEAETVDGTKKFLLTVIGRAKEWRPGAEVNEIERLQLTRQEIYDVDGNHVVVVRCNDIC